MATDHHQLHQLPPLLEVLSKHEHKAVLGHGNPRSHEEAVADVDLVKLGCEGGEETTQRDDQTSHNSSKTDRLNLKVKDKKVR